MIVGNTRAWMAAVVVLLLSITPVPALDFTWVDNNSSDWFSAPNWSPFQPGVTEGPPTDGDTATVNVPDTIFLTGDTDAVDGLTMSSGADLVTNGFTLNVANPGHDAIATLQGLGTQIVVRTGAGASDTGFAGDMVNLESGGQITLFGTDLIITNQLNIDRLSNLKGHGSILLSNVPDLAGPVLNNDGRIAAEGGDLVITALGVGTLDLDGSAGGGFLDLRADGDVTINGALNDPYSGRISVSNGNQLTFDGSIEVDGSIDFLGGSSNLLNGTSITFRRPSVFLAAAGDGRINADTTWDVGSSLTVDAAAQLVLAGTTLMDRAAIEVDGTLDLNGPTEFSGAVVTGGGTVNQIGDAQVRSGSTIGVSVYNMDADGAASVDLFGDLTLNVDRIDTTDNVFDGTLIFNDTAKLTVNLPGTDSWQMAGAVEFNGLPPATATSAIAGSDLRLSGTTTLKGDGVFGIAARTDVAGRVITGGPDSSFSLQGGSIAAPNRLEGGTIEGGGTLDLISGTALVGHGLVDVDIRLLAGSVLRADDGTLTIDKQLLSTVTIGTIGTNDVDGILHLTLPLDTRTGRLDLRGGSVTGQSIMNGTLAIGFGTIRTEGFTNDGRLVADGGTLTIDTTQVPDLDGADGSEALVEAIGSDLVVVPPLADAFDRMMIVGAGRSITFQQGWTLASAGTLELRGGRTGAAAASILGGPQILDGTVTVDRKAAFNAATTFGDVADVQLPDANDLLRLIGDSTIAPNATFAGNGTLLNASGSTMTIEDGSNLGVRLRNEGQVQIGLSPGAATAAAYEQTAGGRLRIDIGGLTPGTGHDQLVVNGDAALDGDLIVALLDPFQLGPGQQFTIIDLRGTLSGGFAGLGENDLVGRFGGFPLFISYAGNGGNGVVLFTPEPGVFLFLAFGAIVRRGRALAEALVRV